MAKKTKDFTGALDEVMQGMNGQPTPAQQEQQDAAPVKTGGRRGRPKKENTDYMQRASFIIGKTLLQELRQLSFTETGRQGRKVTITEVLEDALRAYLRKHKQ